MGTTMSVPVKPKPASELPAARVGEVPDEIDYKYSTVHGMYVPKPFVSEDFDDGPIPGFPDDDVLRKNLDSRAMVYYRPPRPGDKRHPDPHPYEPGQGYYTSIYPRKQLTPAGVILFSPEHIKETLDRVQMSLHRIIKGKFMPQRIHPADAVSIIEDVYVDEGIGIDNSREDRSPANVKKIVYAVSSRAIKRMIAYGYRYLQDHSRYVHAMSFPEVMSHGANENIWGSRKHIEDDEVSFRQQYTIVPGSMATPYWFV